MADSKPRNLHHRVYPFMDHFIQYANERPGQDPWVVRDRSTALRNERLGGGKALLRTWVPTEWVIINEEEE